MMDIFYSIISPFTGSEDISSSKYNDNPMEDTSMMLNKLHETKLYFDWLQGICADKDIAINDKITHIKDGKLFCVSSSIGD